MPGMAVSPARGGITKRLLVMLALLAAVAPFSTDLYLPAFPQIASELDVQASGVQLTLTAFLLGVAGGQLIFGPLSDRFGRFRPLIIGSAICIIAAVAAAAAPSLSALIAARLVQGLSGAASMVIGRAIIADLSVGAASARAFTLMMTIGGVAPVIAPTVGGLLVTGLGWRGVLWVLVGLTALMLAGILAVVPESRPAKTRSAAAGIGRGALMRALKAGRFPGYVLLFGCSFATLMSYISASPFLYQSMMGFSPAVFGALFGANALGMVSCGFMSARLVRRIPARRILSAALPVLVSMVALVFAVVATGVPIVWAAPVIFIAVSSLGFIMGNTTALPLGEVREAAGAGSALLGSTQFVFGAVVSPLTGLAGEHSAWPMAILMLTAAALALALFIFTGRRGAAAEPAPADA